MGMTDVTLTIKSTIDPSKIAKDDFLVDSGAAYTVIPAKIVKKLGLTPNFYRDFVLADGKRVKRPVGSAVIRYGSEEIASPVVLGKTGDSPLLGALTLEAFGLALDPFQRKLYRAKMML
jgi:aspartyl protease family protein